MSHVKVKKYFVAIPNLGTLLSAGPFLFSIRHPAEFYLPLLAIYQGSFANYAR